MVPELIAIQLGAEVQDSITIKSAGFRDTHVEKMRLRLKQAFLVTLRPIFSAVLLADEEVPKVLCLQLRWVAVGVVKDPPDAMRYTLELSAVLRKDGALLAEIRQKVTSDEVFRQRSDAAIAFTNAIEKAVNTTTLKILEHLAASP